MGKCKIVEVHESSSNLINPILVGWDHGTLKDELVSKTKCEVTSSSKSDNVKNTVQVTICDNTIYEGTLEEKPLCRTFLAIRSKSKKKPSHSKVKLFEVSKTLLVEKVPEDKQQESEKEKFEDMDKSDKFYKVFGSKQGLAHHSNIQKMNIVSGVMRDAVKEQISMVKQEEIGNNELDTLSSILPKCDRGATKRDEVYKIPDIIPEDVMDELEGDAKLILKQVKAKELEKDQYTAFFNDNITAITKATIKLEPDVLKEKVKLLIFSELLLKLLNAKHKLGHSKNFTLIDDRPLTNQYILDNFTAESNSSKQISSELQDKALCHAMIFGMLACCYILNLKSLCSSVPVSSEKLQPMLQMVGVVPVPNTDKKVYMLKIPMPPLPASTRGPRGVKRKR